MGPGIYNWPIDIHAVQVIFESNVEYIHMPAPTVSGDLIMNKSEVIPRLKGRGEVWDFLAGYWETGGPFQDHTFGEERIMWDIALVNALLRPELATTQVVGAPKVHDAQKVEQFPDNPRRVTVFSAINSEGILADFWEAVESATSNNPEP
jgi:purine nucleosidase